MTDLVQQRGSKQRTFQLLAECIRVIDREPFGGTSYDVPYEVMFGQRIEHRMSDAASLIASAGAAVVGILGALMLAFPGESLDLAGLVLAMALGGLGFVTSIAMALHWRASRRELIEYRDSKSCLWIRRDRPSVEAVDAFVAEARRGARDRVRSRLLPLGRSDNERKDRAYAYLLCDKGIISAEECAEYVKPPHSPYRDRLG